MLDFPLHHAYTALTYCALFKPEAEALAEAESCVQLVNQLSGRCDNGECVVRTLVPCMLQRWNSQQ
jgi:hypothetical protein